MQASLAYEAGRQSSGIAAFAGCSGRGGFERREPPPSGPEPVPQEVEEEPVARHCKDRHRAESLKKVFRQGRQVWTWRRHCIEQRHQDRVPCGRQNTAVPDNRQHGENRRYGDRHHPVRSGAESLRTTIPAWLVKHLGRTKNDRLNRTLDKKGDVWVTKVEKEPAKG